MTPALLPTAFLLAVLSGVFFSFVGLAYKTASHWECRAAPLTLVFSVVGAAVTMARALREPTQWTHPWLWGAGLLTGVTLYGAVVFIVRVSRMGPNSINWTILQMGLLVPIALAPVLFAEPVRAVDFLIVALFGLMLLAFARGMRASTEVRAGRRLVYALSLAAMFLIQGIHNLVHKVQYELFEGTQAAGYAAIFYVGAAVFALIHHHVQFRRARRITAREWQAGLWAGGCSALGIWAFLASLSLPTVVAFPLSQGTALLGGVLLTALFFREQFNVMKAAGVFLGVAVLLAAAFRTGADKPLSDESPIAHSTERLRTVPENEP